MSNELGGEAASKAPKMASARFGAYNQPGPWVGITVKELRKKVSNMWGVPEDATAFIGKNQLKDDYVIKDKDEIEFHRRMGEKG